jgi:hypothetical protein
MDTVIKVKVDQPLLDVIDARAELAGLSRERLLFFDLQFANARYLQRALELTDGGDE